MAQNKTEAVVDFRDKGRQQVLEELAVEFPVVDGQWTPTVKVADGVLAQIGQHVSALGNTGPLKVQGVVRSSPARRSTARAAYQATRKKILCQRRLSKKARVEVARVVVSSRLLHGAGTWHSLSAPDINAMEDTYMAPFRTIANEWWRPWVHSSELAGGLSSVGHTSGRRSACRDCVLAARLVNASPSLMALLQSDAGRTWKAELFCDIELLSQEKGPRLVEVNAFPTSRSSGVSFQSHGSYWCLRASGSSWNVVSGRNLRKLLPVPVLPTFSCDAVFNKLGAPSVTIKRERISDGGKHAVTSSIRIARLHGGFPVEIEGHSASVFG